MESTTNGLTFVPDRRIDIVNNRDLSVRSCHYALSDEEASILRDDPRVAAVAVPPSPDLKSLSFTQSGDFSRSTGKSANFVNWGLRRCVLESLESTVGSSYPYILDGAGVDIVIQDNGVMSGHPEWKDEQGNSRFIEHDWFAVTGTAGSMPGGHYGDVGNHGTHVAGIAAGKTYGWAKGARIYSIRYDLFDSEAFDLIKVWHQQKPVDPNTGVKRPTIVNASWGYRWYYNNNNNGGSMASLFYRSVSQTPAVNSNFGMIANAHNFTYTPADVDQEELTDAGVICVRAAGNYYHKIDVSGGLDWDNYYTWTTDWGVGSVTAGNPIYYHRSGSPFSDDTILVANADSQPNGSLEQCRQDSERGPGVFIAAPGDDITSTTNSSGFGASYDDTYPGDASYKISRIGGTSMAAPQVTGALALFLQLNPTATSQQCKDWLANVASRSQMYSTGLDNDYTNSRSLMGGPNRFLYFPYGKDVGFRFKGVNVS
jgi:subtilisin family serine protease